MELVNLGRAVGHEVRAAATEFNLGRLSLLAFQPQPHAAGGSRLRGVTGLDGQEVDGVAQVVAARGERLGHLLVDVVQHFLRAVHSAEKVGVPLCALFGREVCRSRQQRCDLGEHEVDVGKASLVELGEDERLDAAAVDIPGQRDLEGPDTRVLVGRHWVGKDIVGPPLQKVFHVLLQNVELVLVPSGVVPHEVGVRRAVCAVLDLEQDGRVSVDVTLLCMELEEPQRSLRSLRGHPGHRGRLSQLWSWGGSRRWHWRRHRGCRG
mmetsp:Transcript_17275/g.40659  ORF Transcript_17275/g.40659 Transcript_17275/m.40659 type:complete len:265 (-) Transcript_17275:762-1556(-)